MSRPFLDLIKNVVDKVQENNRKNPNVKTADGSVFKNILEKIKKNKNIVEPPKEVVIQPKSRIPGSVDPVSVDPMEHLRKHVQEVRVENEADPNIETADGSVFEEMMKEIEMLKSKVAENEANASANQPVDSAPSYPSSNAEPKTMAMSNAGGLLELREQPDMSAPKKKVHLPDSAIVQVLKYSDNHIILDGQKSHFALIEFEGNRGWVLDSYLNYN